MALFFLLAFLYFKLGPNNWLIVSEVDKPQIEKGWGEPQKVGINTDKWEGGAYVSGDGEALFYSYYPGDLISDMALGQLKEDIDIYYSLKPFNQIKKHALSEDKWSEGGVMVSGSDVYYMSDRYHFNSYDLYKNGHVIFNTPDKSEKDPYYCAQNDELYFTIDGVIYVYKKDKTTALPAPINDGSFNGQPFLTLDCKKIYFSSTKGDGISKILRAEKISEKSWSEPAVVVQSRYGVMEPALTDNGQIMFFAQVLKSAKGVVNSDIFYIEKEKNN